MFWPILLIFYVIFGISNARKCYGGVAKLGEDDAFDDHVCPSRDKCFVHHYYVDSNGTREAMTEKGCVEEAMIDEFKYAVPCLNFDMFNNTFTDEELTHQIRCVCYSDFCNKLFAENPNSANYRNSSTISHLSRFIDEEMAS
ncbi:unnamed protein product [Caenorhabditis auriculariae]|uniref:DUF19 domain-containing protein n=1 Tax=Caenorhabditis auriculariae TaxID=2777116 RepID=A0A8S1HQ81_9PELO|nr:unnamed protein product [Caenorhabditis auriculariae]